MFKLEINTDNAAFETEPVTEVARSTRAFSVAASTLR